MTLRGLKAEKIVGLGSEGDCRNSSGNGDVSRVGGDDRNDSLLTALTVKGRMTNL